MKSISTMSSRLIKRAEALEGLCQRRKYQFFLSTIDSILELLLHGEGTESNWRNIKLASGVAYISPLTKTEMRKCFRMLDNLLFRCRIEVIVFTPITPGLNQLQFVCKGLFSIEENQKMTIDSIVLEIVLLCNIFVH